MTTTKKQEINLPDKSAADNETTYLDQIIEQYGRLSDKNTENGKELRQKILQTIQNSPALLRKSHYSHFLAQEVSPEDVAALEWESPHHMILFSESLYHSRFENKEVAQRLNQHASIVL